MSYRRATFSLLLGLAPLAGSGQASVLGAPTCHVEVEVVGTVAPAPGETGDRGRRSGHPAAIEARRDVRPTHRFGVEIQRAQGRDCPRIGDVYELSGRQDLFPVGRSFRSGLVRPPARSPGGGERPRSYVWRPLENLDRTPLEDPEDGSRPRFLRSSREPMPDRGASLVRPPSSEPPSPPGVLEIRPGDPTAR